MPINHRNRRQQIYAARRLWSCPVCCEDFVACSKDKRHLVMLGDCGHYACGDCVNDARLKLDYQTMIQYAAPADFKRHTDEEPGSKTWDLSHCPSCRGSEGSGVQGRKNLVEGAAGETKVALVETELQALFGSKQLDLEQCIYSQAIRCMTCCRILTNAQYLTPCHHVFCCSCCEALSGPNPKVPRVDAKGIPLTKNGRDIFA
eukprot:198521_1